MARRPTGGGHGGPAGVLRPEALAREALFRVQMPTPDQTCVEQGRRARWRIDRVHRADGREEFDAVRDVTRTTATGFVTAAKGRPD
ncbi:hypothetical protein ACH4UM_20065 [Streptomyces sp. NPDC020801]|uniref:hypothetical protein n=1 Tax=unclassified Streptomyces TaxID=2593676 RepID=UPI00378FCE56